MCTSSESVATRLRGVVSELPAGVNLVAVSKFHPAASLQEAYDAGQRRFGESRVQELLPKIEALPADIKWHFIGHLQTNKVKQIVGKVDMIESVDTERLLNIIDAEAAKAGVTQKVLLQVHVAREETKFGFSPEELIGYFRREAHSALKATHICGIMGMASNTDDTARVNDDFRRIADVFNEIASLPGITGFETLSMGMSGDWRLAVEQGSNLVRIGTAIFGQRVY